MKQIIFNKAQLLEELNIAENTLRSLIENKGFPAPRKMGAKLFWLISEIEEWLRGCPTAWVKTSKHQDYYGASAADLKRRKS